MYDMAFSRLLRGCPVNFQVPNDPDLLHPLLLSTTLQRPFSNRNNDEMFLTDISEATFFHLRIQRRIQDYFALILYGSRLG